MAASCRRESAASQAAADFKTAIQAGSLIDKSGCPARLLKLAEVILESPDSVHREQSAMQRLVKCGAVTQLALAVPAPCVQTTVGQGQGMREAK